ncbi:MAG: hypothetical protein KDA78_08020 [Planctomycetaceae bacterium]|nr:hypothetical protein [Planctomycetaceae bacterium]
MQSDNQIFQRFLDVRTYLGWSPDDDQCSEELTQILVPHSREMIDDFYTQILRHAATSRVLSGGELQIERLKSSMRFWFEQMLLAKHDYQFVLQRWKVGHRHVEIGLSQVYVNAAFGRMRSQLSQILCKCDNMPLERKIFLHESLNRRLDLDLTIMSDAYHVENQSRQIPVDHARLQQQKLLAQLSGHALAGAELQSIFDLAVAFLQQAFHSDKVEFLEYGSDGQFLLRSGAGWPSDWLGKPFGNRKHDPQLEFLSEHHGCFEIQEWQIQTQYQPLPAWKEAHLASALQMAVREENHLLGILSVHFQNPRSFVPSDHDFLYSIGNLLASAIHRKQIENLHAENVGQLRRLVDRLPAGAVYVIGDTIQINHTVELMTGYSREQLRTRGQWQELVVSEESSLQSIEHSSVVSAGERIEQRSLEIRRIDGTIRTISQIQLQSRTDEVWLLHDVTEESERRSQQLQSERLAAIGQMITGLAHESRNALQRIQACTEMLELHVQDNSAAQGLIVRLQSAQDDLQQLFDEVRNYASPVALAIKPVPLERIIQEAWNLLEQARSRREACLKLMLNQDSCTVQGDRFRLIQVFRNLLENSLAACSDPVEITVNSQRNLHQRGLVSVIYQDNGPGLSEEATRRVFEPFFTTKSKGSGLGMAIANRIIAAHGGTMKSEQQVGCGATFRITLPADDLVTSESDPSIEAQS